MDKKENMAGRIVVLILVGLTLSFTIATPIRKSSASYLSYRILLPLVGGHHPIPPAPANCLQVDVNLSHDPQQGTWYTTQNTWRIINFWVGDYSLHKLLLAPEDNPGLLGGGSLWSWTTGCESVVRAEYSKNTLPPVTINELTRLGFIEGHPCLSQIQIEVHPPVAGTPWTPRGKWRMVEFWTNEPNHSQTLRKLFLWPGQIIVSSDHTEGLFGGGTSFGFPDDCDLAMYRFSDFRSIQWPLPIVNLEQICKEGLVYDSRKSGLVTQCS